MTNEEKILELLMRMQKDIVELKQGQERLEVKVNLIDTKIDKVSDTQVVDIYTLTQMTKVDGKMDVLNKRLFDQEAEIQVLKRVK